MRLRSQEFLESEGIKSIVAPPYKHNVGTEVDTEVKNRIREAYAYASERAVYKHLRFLEVGIRRLWGRFSIGCCRWSIFGCTRMTRR